MSTRWAIVVVDGCGVNVISAAAHVTSGNRDDARHDDLAGSTRLA